MEPRYSLIMLWPHTDECDRTAKRGEGNKSHRTNTLEQVKTKAVGDEREGTFSIVFLCCIRFHHRESKVTEITVCSREDAGISMPAGASSLILQAICYRIANTTLNSLNEKKKTMLQSYGKFQTIFHNILRKDAITFLFIFLPKKGKVKYQRLYYVLMTELQ